MIKGLKKVVDGKVFQGIILFVIIFNAAIMGVETIKGNQIKRHPGGTTRCRYTKVNAFAERRTK